MDNNNYDGGFGFPTYGNEPPNNQQNPAPSFGQMNQEFFQGQSQRPQQPQQDQGFGQQSYQDQGFGQQFAQDQGYGQSNQDEGFGQSAHTAPQGWVNQGQAPTDPFGNSSLAAPFSGAVTQGDDSELKWWQKGARVFLIGGAGILLLAILIFVIATNLNNREAKNPQDLSDIQIEQPATQQPATQQPQTPAVVKPDPSKWQEIGNTEGYSFVETRIGEFIVKDLILYFKDDGGLQVRSAAVGTLEGYPGTYEVDLPRTAALFDKITLGYKFMVSFDVYKAADSASIFIENIRPDK